MLSFITISVYFCSLIIISAMCSQEKSHQFHQNFFFSLPKRCCILDTGMSMYTKYLHTHWYILHQYLELPETRKQGKIFSVICLFANSILIYRSRNLPTGTCNDEHKAPCCKWAIRRLQQPCRSAREPRECKEPHVPAAPSQKLLSVGGEKPPTHKQIQICLHNQRENWSFIFYLWQ